MDVDPPYERHLQIALASIMRKSIFLSSSPLRLQETPISFSTFSDSDVLQAIERICAGKKELCLQKLNLPFHPDVFSNFGTIPTQPCVILRSPTKKSLTHRLVYDTSPAPLREDERKIREKRVADPLSITLISAAGVAVGPVVVKAAAGLGVLIATFVGGLFAGMAVDEDEDTTEAVRNTEKKIEAVMSSKTVSGQAILEVCKGLEGLCLEKVLPAVRETRLLKETTMEEAAEANAALRKATEALRCTISGKC
ncbi:hypothetical protein QR680_012213 [Steinernema hermaphroditum]|uniref:Uncharacterized protein n=1 Tax=Steinernema hermaphroditum TaxID=289476 RepID=A0AA39LZH3_9BILA|nr:hypothetical protein QR680_012213 [Steinernema hermaphroditum]